MGKKAVTGVVVAVAVVIIAAIALVSLRSRTLRIEDVLASYRADSNYTGITVGYPGDGTLFPPEIVPPTFRWSDTNPRCTAWVIRMEFADAAPEMSFLAHEPRWTPSPPDWEMIKRRSLERDARVAVLGVAASGSPAILTGARLSLRTSQDEVGAPLFYREVNLPFIDAVKDPSRIRWRFGSVSSPQPPPIVLQDLPVCGNCHSFSRDGSVLAMDVDYANSKGSYVITKVQPEVTLTASDVITWDSYRKEDGEQTFGLLSQISPDGRYVVSTVKDKSVFVPQPNLAFSQLFFPLKGILCIYDRQAGTFRALPGADNPEFVQSNPTWSPDGKHIVFARARAYDLKNTRGQGKILLTREECKEFVEDGKPFLFDLYRLPFNDGQGGIPEPIPGASNNGVSNFFPRYSPDGRWLVFCKARSYMLLQPDSELYIIPADGGEPRKLRANTRRMNSWHSWSPNGKWLAFSSKAYSDYTQLCLTHIDESGDSTPAVLLAHLTAPDRAANIPEFVNTQPTAIVKIREQFLTDYSFVRAGNEFFNQGEADNAIAEYSKALELNPDNVIAHHKLGFLLYQVKGQYDQGMMHLLKAYKLDAQNPRIEYDLGMAYMHQGKLDDAARLIFEAIRGAPDGYDYQYEPVRMRLSLAEVLIAAGQSKQAEAPLRDALRRRPNHPEVHYRLAVALADMGRTDEALAAYDKAVSLQPQVDTSPALHHLLATGLLQSRKFREALQHEEKALALARRQGDEQMAGKIEEHIALCKRLLDTAK